MNIALIAHDAKKKLMQNFCIAYRGILTKNELFATGTTGRLIEEVTNLNVHKFLAGHLGGVLEGTRRMTRIINSLKKSADRPRLMHYALGHDVLRLEDDATRED